MRLRRNNFGATIEVHKNKSITVVQKSSISYILSNSKYSTYKLNVLVFIKKQNITNSLGPGYSFRCDTIHGCQSI